MNQQETKEHKTNEQKCKEIGTNKNDEQRAEMKQKCKPCSSKSIHHGISRSERTNRKIGSGTTRRKNNVHKRRGGIRREEGDEEGEEWKAAKDDEGAPTGESRIHVEGGGECDDKAL